MQNFRTFLYNIMQDENYGNLLPKQNAQGYFY